MFNLAPSLRALDEQTVGWTLPTRQNGSQDRACGRLHVDRIDDLSGFAGLSREWDELLERSGERSPFLTWEWLYPWWQHLASDQDLYLLTVRTESGRLVGLAPLFRSWTGLDRWDRCRRLGFLGTGAAASDYLNVIVDPAVGCPVVAALVDYLVAHRTEWDVLSLTDVEEKAWTLSMIRTLFQTRAFRAVISIAPGPVCPYARLDGGWEPYLQSRSSDLRYQIKRKHGMLSGQRGARLEVIDRAQELPRALKALIALHLGRRAAVGGRSAWEHDSMVAFLHATTPLLQERGWLRLYRLLTQDGPVAMLYGLVYRGTFHYYQSGWDVAWSAWSLGTVLQSLCIRQACAEGLAEYDFLRGDEAYKARWAPYVRGTVRLDVIQQTPRTTIYRGARRILGCLRSARRRLRDAIGV